MTHNNITLPSSTPTNIPQHDKNHHTMSQKDPMYGTWPRPPLPLPVALRARDRAQPPPSSIVIVPLRDATPATQRTDFRPFVLLSGWTRRRPHEMRILALAHNTMTHTYVCFQTEPTLT